MIPKELRENIARNIRNCRREKFPGRGGGKQCAEAFGVSPQQWSPWERGKRTPSEARLAQLADFFDTTVEWMRGDHSRPSDSPGPRPKQPPRNSGNPETFQTPFDSMEGVDFAPPPRQPAPPGSAASFFWLARGFFFSVETNGLRLDRQSLDYLAHLLKTQS